MKGPACFRLFAIIAMGLAAFVASASVGAEEAARFDDENALFLPQGYRSWIYVGTTVTPNDMNDGKAAFPEFQVVYMDPASFKVYQNSGEFPDGAILVKETLSVGSKQASSGNGYFMGDYVGLFA